MPLNIFYKDHVINEEVRNRIQDSIEVHDDLPSHGEDTENQMSQHTTKPAIRLVRPAKTQISLRIRAVWSESSLIACAFYSTRAI